MDNSLQLIVTVHHPKCSVELRWGKGQYLSATLDYPQRSIEFYDRWRSAYLAFYSPANFSSSNIEEMKAEDNLRGRVITSTSVDSTNDFYSSLVKAEAALIEEFHKWLRDQELDEIRSTILSRVNLNALDRRCSAGLDIFLLCKASELARLPWEAWKIIGEPTSDIRILRVPAKIQQPPSSKRSSIYQAGRRKVRILAVLGDSTGLNLEQDRVELQSLKRVAEVKFVSWQPQQSGEDIRKEVGHAIADEQGWDILFFAGHSNEAQLIGGELKLAPGVSISVSEIKPYLLQAKERGLQFALFNSCDGLDIANELISLGLCQVAIMREPIHNRVAQRFLMLFLRQLEMGINVKESLFTACQVLRQEHGITFPSAYLLPSLFCHPGASFFQISPNYNRRSLQQWRFRRSEKIALLISLILGIIPIDGFGGIVPPDNLPLEQLLQLRIWVQAVYRDKSGKVPSIPDDRAPILLVQIDEASIDSDDRLKPPYPINRPYLSELVRELNSLKAQVIGIDYFLDKPEKEEAVLRQSVQNAVNTNHVWITFAASSFEDDKSYFAAQKGKVAEENWSMEGYTNGRTRIMLPQLEDDCSQACPFAYLQVLLRTAIDSSTNSSQNSLPLPNLEPTNDLRTDLLQWIDRSDFEYPKLYALSKLRLQPVTAAVRNSPINQVWLQPIIDFSIPMDRVYMRLSAKRLLEEETQEALKTTSKENFDLSKKIVIIASGAYPDAGTDSGIKDFRSLPPAIGYWQTKLGKYNDAAFFEMGRKNDPAYLDKFTGGEALAYTVHHIMNNHLIIPIPDLWTTGLASFLGKAISILIRQQQKYQKKKSQQKNFVIGCCLANGIYGLASLELYVSAGILLPILLPSLMFWIAIAPIAQGKSND
jgi:CHASE2 domain